MKREISILATIGLFTVIISCGGGPGPNGPVGETAQQLTDKGFAALFQRAQIDSAKSFFRRALTEDSAFADAYTGLGYALGFQDSLSTAVTNFNRANDNGLQEVDAFVGLAAAYRDLPNLVLSVQNAELALAGNASYVFDRNPRITFEDIHLIIAQASFRRGQSFFQRAQTAVNVLDPENGLDPDNPNSWIVNSVQFATYSEALLAEIELLEGLFGGVF